MQARSDLNFDVSDETNQAEPGVTVNTSAIHTNHIPIPYHLGYAFNQKLINYGFILKFKHPKLLFSRGFRQRRYPTSASKRFGVMTSLNAVVTHPNDWVFRHQVEGMRLLLYHPNLSTSIGLESERFLVTFMEADNLDRKEMFSPVPRRRRFADHGMVLFPYSFEISLRSCF
ncbi:unnamed protein product [Owenia fusiformis]|uniref:Uncharacterized protein n=1 Tax=Owenia fusiformis TaxID=6347 RepID=A0A8J1U5W8_OWEFU|nr:unnamed protein product [Owenia fusiformis]